MDNLEIAPPPPDSPEQIEEKRLRAAAQEEYQVQAAEAARSIVDTMPAFEPTPVEPLPAPEPASPMPDMTRPTSADFLPAAEVTEPFAPTREGVAADEQRAAESAARAEALRLSGVQSTQEGVRLGVLSPEPTNDEPAPSSEAQQ